MRRVSLVLAVLLLAVPGCAGQKKASDANFKKAINDFLSKSPLYVEIQQKLPADVSNAFLQDQFVGRNLPALEKAGLLRSSPVTVSQPGVNDGPGRRFELTDLGRKLAVPAAWNPDIMHFVYAKKAVHSIVNWTDPGDGDMVKVTYTYELDDVPEWAKLPEVQSSFGLDQVFAEAYGGSKKKEETILMILTNKGWEVKN
ncbi:MAG TPA: hypothetical protein VGI45_20330 [Terracidiphilus sp.]|jgi:hypothetical protein